MLQILPTIFKVSNISYLLESDSREAAIFAFLSALAGSQAAVFLPYTVYKMGKTQLWTVGFTLL